MARAAIRSIPPPRLDEFLSGYFIPSRPVIIRDLYRGQPIDQLRSPADVARELGDVSVAIRPNYAVTHPGLRRDPTPDGRGLTWTQATQTTLGAFLAAIEARAEEARFVADEPIPVDLLARFETPEIARSAPALPELDSNIFLARKGSYAHLHFDTDHRHVLLTQIFGDKRFVLFDPSAARRLLPLNSFSGLCIEHMSEPERSALFESAGAMEAVLRPGETLYIPALMWHFVEYLDTAMSWNIRFGLNRYGRFFASNFHSDFHLQSLGALFRGPDEPSHRHSAIVDQLVDTFERPWTGRMERYRAVRDTLRDLWSRHAHDGMAHGPFLFDLSALEDSLVEKALPDSSQFETLVNRPDAGAPDPPASRDQIDDIITASRRVGYTAALLERVAEGLVGATPLSELPRAQADRLLQYLGSTAARPARHG